MDRIAYCQRTNARLRELRDEFSARAFPEPATAVAAGQMTARRQATQAALERISAMLTRVEALAARSTPDWDEEKRAEKREIDRELTELEDVASR